MFDLSESSGFADYFIIMTATSARHAQSLADALTREHGSKFENPEGYASGSWILIDMGSVVVHIFQEDARLHYNFDNLWDHVPSTEIGTQKKRSNIPSHFLQA